MSLLMSKKNPVCTLYYSLLHSFPYTTVKFTLNKIDNNVNDDDDNNADIIL